ncbi:MAG: response regulator [Syntrophobacteraceae bacterium]
MTNEKRLIIIADDDADDVMLITEALRDAGFAGRIKSVENGFELIEELNHGSVHADLVLLDLSMPKMSGHEALKRIRSCLKSLPIVVHSTSCSRTDISICYRTGANSYVVKAPSYDGLMQNMKSIVDYWFRTASLPPEIA